MICQNVKHSLQIADESLQPQPSPPPPTDAAAVHLTSATSSSGLLPAIANAQQLNGLLATGSYKPIKHAAAAAISMRDDVTEGQNDTVDNDFIPNIEEWMVAVRQFTSDYQLFLVNNVAISMTFADMAHSEKMLTRAEYNSLRSFSNETERARFVFVDVLPRKTYSQFLVAIQALRESGSTGPAEYIDGKLTEIKAGILRNRSAATSPKSQLV